MRRRAGRGGWVFMVPWLGLLACQTPTHKHHTPEAPALERSDGRNLQAAASLAVVGPPGEQDGVVIGILPASSMSVDYREYGDELVRVVREAIRASPSGAKGSARTLELSVLHVVQGHGVCHVHARAETSSGYVHGFAGDARSMWFEKGCNAAITRLAGVILEDPEIRRFIEGRDDPSPSE